jgi:uncharacterized protein (DUF2147 family)
MVMISGRVAATPIEGHWLTDDGKAEIAIVRCARDICGSISKILDKGPDVPAADIRNPNPRLRTRPLIGLPILMGFSPSGGTWKGGHAYDPKTGTNYRSTLAMQGADRLKVTGCVLFFCESKYWTRLRWPAAGQPSP